MRIHTNEILLLKLGELVLKGLNRRAFENRLLANLRRKLQPCGEFNLYAMQSIIYCEPLNDKCDLDAAFELSLKTFGVAAVSRALACEKNAEVIATLAVEYLKADMLNAKSFKVESKRADKRFPMTSIELSQYIGGILAEAYPNVKVDVHAPELTVNIEIRETSAFISGKNVTAAGGLPVGTGGSAVALLSGGIDSPVAVWMMARRGLHIIPVHFHSPPYTSELARQKVETLAKILLPYCEKLRVEYVNFTDTQEKIRRHCSEGLFTLLSRRAMTRIACQIAESQGCGSIITGENLGQVASQTQAAIAVTEQAATLPVLRPLIGLDKREIIEYARKIGTLETSELPYEDCCTVFTPKHPKTKPRLEEVLAEERLIPNF